METKQIFESRGQGQVFRFWNDLSESERSDLLEQAKEIDLDELDRLVASLVKGQGAGVDIDFSKLLPAPYTPRPRNPSEDPLWQEAKQLGEAALRAGKVAAFTVAGGQGTRLGYDGPKGTFPVTPVKGKSLFQVFAEKIRAANALYGREIPWFVMTSHVNHEETKKFFEGNGYFGLAEDSVIFFKQGRMPAVDREGRIILESKGSIAMSPDGHGGALRALERSGALETMEAKGIEILSYFQVDNPLVQAIDPYFIGFHLKSGSSMSSKMVPKAYESEKLGHFCVQDGKMLVVEYSDMPEELCALRDSDGELSFRAGSIAIHVISVSFARSIAQASEERSLPFHRADKKIAYVADNGEIVKPDQANGIKFEMFVFDAIPFADNPLVIETTRLDDFSPVKNAEGVDSPESSKADQVKLFSAWLESVGLKVPDTFSGSIEIAPTYAIDRESFVAAWAANPKQVDFSSDVYIG